MWVRTGTKDDVYVFLSSFSSVCYVNEGTRKVHGVPQYQATALLRHQKEEETDKTKQALIEQTYEKH